jgi:hypothetical protein
LNLARIAGTTKPVDLADWPRIFQAKHRATPTDTGFGSSRFSSRSKSFRVLYAADAFLTAFAEAVVRDRFQGKARRYLSQPELEGLVATEISTTRPLQLVDLRGAAAYELGINTDARGARDHTAGQTFAEDIHTHTNVDGILFDSRLTAANCVAIFDRAFPLLVATPAVDLLSVAALPVEISRLGIIVRRRRHAYL